MDYWKYRTDRLNRGLREIADEMGYTPGEFSLLRFTQDAKRVKGWMEDVERGLVPEELGHLTPGEAKKLARREADSLIDRERAWLPFFYPTMKASDISVSGSGGGPLQVQIVRHGDTDTE